ncbi:hypothetical protein [Curtobacterium sp. 9128]|uniref:hypothetical protein n=1 Tax=Curtobacterium sp. 9128 TaxID=1793722 RepID=UPI0011A78A86|nr:hypothetical protein [Curtobacterium sp. 9128]
MNTEPPTGDDLQQMLVTMKQHVLTRAELDHPTPRRRGRRAGIVIGIIAVLGIGATSGGVALGMIPQPFTAAPAPSPTMTEPPETPTRSSAPVVNEPTTTPTPESSAGVIPSDCHSLVPASEYGRLFGGTPLQDPAGTDFGNGSLPGQALWCIWHDPGADVSGIDISLGTPTDQPAMEQRLVDSGYACSDRDGGRFCQLTTMADPYPVETTVTYFVRGSTWVRIGQTNAPTNGLLAAIEQQVWG